MTRVLYLHTTSEIGGSAISLLRLVEGLDPSRYASIVVLPSDGPFVTRLRAAGARVEIMPELLTLTSRRGAGFLLRFVWNYPTAVRCLAWFIRRERIGLVHTNTIHNLYGVAAARLARVPHVWHFREIVWQLSVWRRVELWMAQRWSARIVVTSRAIASMYGPERRWPVHLIRVPNGVDAARFQPGDAPAVRAVLGAGPADVLVGIVCRLDAWKGVDDFLAAAARVARERSGVRFAVVGGAIIGQASYAEALARSAETMGIGDRVVFTGWTFGPADMPDVYRALDVLVLASREPEPFGLVVIEAMATGRPVIATGHGGPLDIVEDGRTGLLVPPRDPDALAAGIVALADDPARRQRMGAHGRERVLAHYTAAQYVAGIDAVYRELVV